MQKNLNCIKFLLKIILAKLELYVSNNNRSKSESVFDNLIIQNVALPVPGHFFYT